MTDARYKKLAKLLVEYSTELKKNDRVLLDMIDVPDEFSIELMRAARAAGALPVVEVRHTRINRELLRDTNGQHAGLVRDLELFRMKKTDRVHIKAPGTDLTFSIKGIGAKMCKGDRNIPDGEVFSCPVKNSIQGRIQFNTPTLYSGMKFENVCLEFKDGKVVRANSN